MSFSCIHCGILDVASGERRIMTLIKCAYVCAAAKLGSHFINAISLLTSVLNTCSSLFFKNKLFCVLLELEFLESNGEKNYILFLFSNCHHGLLYSTHFMVTNTSNEYSDDMIWYKCELHCIVREARIEWDRKMACEHQNRSSQMNQWVNQYTTDFLF